MLAGPLKLYKEPEVSRLHSEWDEHEDIGIEELPIQFAFDEEKGKALIKYLLRALGGTYNYMALLKLVFFVDRYHVRQYGRPVTADDYFAMKLGPVPSNLLRMIQKTEGSGYTLRLAKDALVDEDEFSPSDIEAMQFAIERFGEIGRKDPFALAELTHAYPEWDQWRTKFEANPGGREDIDYTSFVKNAAPEHTVFQKLGFTDPFEPLTEEEQELLIWQMRETSR